MNVLYVARDKNDYDDMCPGSQVCLSIVEKMPPKVVRIQDCDKLRSSQDLPDWLNGTPIFVNEEEGIIYRGRDAVRRLRELADSVSQENIYEDRPTQADTRPSTEAREAKQKAIQDAEDPFHMDVPQNVEEPRGGKVTEQDLQKFMEQRKQSPAGQTHMPPQ